MNDNEFREVFHSLAAHDAHVAPPFSRARVEAQQLRVRAQRKRRAWYTASGLALAAAATLLFVVMPRRELLDLDLSGTKLQSATDFLLNTPGSSLLRSVPSFGITPTTRNADARPSAGGTVGRDK